MQNLGFYCRLMTHRITTKGKKVSPILVGLPSNQDYCLLVKSWAPSTITMGLTIFLSSGCKTVQYNLMQQCIPWIEEVWVSSHLNTSSPCHSAIMLQWLASDWLTDWLRKEDLLNMYLTPTSRKMHTDTSKLYVVYFDRWTVFIGFTQDS